MYYKTCESKRIAIDCDRTLTALECAIQSCEPAIRKRPAIAISDWRIPVVDRNITILLNAVDDPDLNVQLKIVSCIRERIDHVVRGHYSNNVNISPKLIERCISETKPILRKNATHPNREVRDCIIDLLFDSEPDEHELTSSLLNDLSHTYKMLKGVTTVRIEPSNLLEFVTYLKQDVRASTTGKLSQIDNDSIVSILLELLHDPEFEMREAAVNIMVELGNSVIFPILLELVSNAELVATAISELRNLADYDSHAAIFSNFHCNRDITLKFIETAEKTCIENIRNKTHRVNGEVFALRAIGSDSGIATLQEILEANDSYHDIDQAVLSLADIGTERAMSVLLSFLPDLDVFYGWIAIQFHNLGKLGLIPHLWSAERQIHSYRGSELIATIQEREGLYNPDFSDRSHPLFESPRPRLRHILLGDPI